VRGAGQPPDETTVMGVSTTRIFTAATIATTEKGGTGVATIMTISEASDLVTTTMR